MMSATIQLVRLDKVRRDDRVVQVSDLEWVKHSLQTLFSGLPNTHRIVQPINDDWPPVAENYGFEGDGERSRFFTIGRILKDGDRARLRSLEGCVILHVEVEGEGRVLVAYPGMNIAPFSETFVDGVKVQLVNQLSDFGTFVLDLMPGDQGHFHFSDGSGEVAIRVLERTQA